MNNREYKLLVENWNNYLLAEDKICILEENLTQRNLINENFLKNLRAKGIKNSVLIPILLIKTISLYTDVAHAHDGSENNLPTYSQVQAAADEHDKISTEDFDENDFKQACKVVNKFKLFNPKDLNKDRNVFDKIFNKSNEADIEDLFRKSFKKGLDSVENQKVNKLFQGVYTKVTAQCLNPESSEKVTKEIYDSVTKLYKNKSSDIIKVNVASDFDLHVGIMKPGNYKNYADIITKVFFEDKLSVKKNGKDFPDLKNKILQEVSNSFFKMIKNKTEKGLTYPYHYFTFLLNKALDKTLNSEDMKGITISLENIDTGEHGGLILLSPSASEAVVEHELGHVISMNIDDVRENINNSYYDFMENMHSNQKEKITLKDVTDFLLKKVSSQYNFNISDINDLNESGQKKLIENSKLFINMLIGSGCIKALEDGSFKLEVSSGWWDIYLHSLEERVETIHHSLIEGLKMDKSTLIKTLKKVKKITKKNVFYDKYEKKNFDIQAYGEWQKSLLQNDVDNDISQKLSSLMGIELGAKKAYDKEYVISQMDNLIILIDSNFD
jgi:hypothetical protein